MVNVFGDLIAELPELAEGELLPSPESLRGKIVIKGKMVKNGEVRERRSTRANTIFASQPFSVKHGTFAKRVGQRLYSGQFLVCFCPFVWLWIALSSVVASIYCFTPLL